MLSADIVNKLVNRCLIGDSVDCEHLDLDEILDLFLSVDSDHEYIRLAHTINHYCMCEISSRKHEKFYPNKDYMTSIGMPVVCYDKPDDKVAIFIPTFHFSAFCLYTIIDICNLPKTKHRIKNITRDSNYSIHVGKIVNAIIVIADSLNIYIDDKKTLTYKQVFRFTNIKNIINSFFH